MNYSASEMMTVAAARALSNDDVCFVGIGLPSAACNLARLTHAPRITLIYESGTLATRPDVLPLSIGDGELCATALTTVSVPEIFRYWLQGGRITVGFLGGAQIDRFGNLNTTVIGKYPTPKVRLPGAGGAPEIASSCGQVYIVMRQGLRSFVNEIDFLTSMGHGRTGTERKSLGLQDQVVRFFSSARFVYDGSSSFEQRVHGCLVASGRDARPSPREYWMGHKVRRLGDGNSAAESARTRDSARSERAYRAGTRQNGRRSVILRNGAEDTK